MTAYATPHVPSTPDTVREAREKRKQVLAKAAYTRKRNDLMFLKKRRLQAELCYNGCVMSSHLTPIDITNMPDLVRLAEEVATTKKSRELKRDN